MLKSADIVENFVSPGCAGARALRYSDTDPERVQAMSLGLSKLILLLVVTCVAIREGHRILVELGPQTDIPEEEDPRYAGIGVGALLTLVIVGNSFPALSGVWNLWFDQAQYVWPSSDAPGRLVLFGRQFEVILIVSNLVMVVWGGARRVSVGSSRAAEEAPSSDDLLLSASFDRRSELLMRGGALLLGFAILMMAGANHGFRWFVWLVFLPLAALAVDRGADFLVRFTHWRPARQVSPPPSKPPRDF